MKNKTLQKVLCFCLALCFCFSIAIKPVQAHAVATEAWMVYALITYLAAMGITFTVAGGVDAMVQAMEEKVKDYEQANNITDFYQYMRNRNVRLVPNNNQDPDGNPFFDLFFTASAVEAIQTFAQWLVNHGWGLGTSGSININPFLYTATLGDVSETFVTSTFQSTPQINGNVLKSYGDHFTIREVISPADSLGYQDDPKGLTVIWPSTASSTRKYWFYKNTSDKIYIMVSDDIEGGGTVVTNLDAQCTIVIYKSNTSGYHLGLYELKPDGTYSRLCQDTGLALYAQSELVFPFTSEFTYITPEELQEQFPSVDQGVSIVDAISVPMGDPSLIEWGNRIEETFIETGTIPQPQPEVITDPDYAPSSSPVPTPVPPPEIEDIDDLGLPTLGNAIINKFPFSLPKDLKRIAVILNAEPVTPFWEVNLYETLGNRVPFVGDTTIRIDLAEYEALGQISRWASVITFVIFLVIITKGVIRW